MHKYSRNNQKSGKTETYEPATARRPTHQQKPTAHEAPRQPLGQDHHPLLACYVDNVGKNWENKNNTNLNQYQTVNKSTEI